MSEMSEMASAAACVDGDRRTGVSEDVLDAGPADRIGGRTRDFMPPSLLGSQCALTDAAALRLARLRATTHPLDGDFAVDGDDD